MEISGVFPTKPRNINPPPLINPQVSKKPIDRSQVEADSNFQRRKLVRTINGRRRGGGERCSFERSRDIMDSRKSTQSNIYYFFPRKVWGWRERGGVARAADKNTFVISLMVVPFYRFSVRHTPPQLDVFWWRPFNRSSTELRFLDNS